MKIIAGTAEGCNSNPTANNNAASAESASRGIFTGGGKELEPGDKWIFFNPELAELLGGKDGIICAVVSYGLYLWLKVPQNSFGYCPTIDGKKACYRSTRQLMAEYTINGESLWDDTTIFKALKRTAKKKCGLIVDASRKQLHFAMTERMLKMHKSTDGFIAFKLSEAIQYGVLEAILLNNLGYQLKNFKDVPRDDDGRKYGELSATKLTTVQRDLNYNERRFLPVSKDAASDALKHLREGNAIIQHPTRKGFYRRIVARENCQNGSKQRVAKISSPEAKISNGEAKISSREELVIPNSANINDLQPVSETLDSNVDSNKNRKCIIPHPESSLRSNSECGRAHCSSCVTKNSNLSVGGQILLKVMNEELMNLQAQQEEHRVIPKNDYRVYKVHDYDQVEFIGYEYPYDFLCLDAETNKPYSRHAEIDYSIQHLKDLFRVSSFRYTSSEIAQLRQLFIEHPLLTFEHIRILLKWCEPRVQPLYIGDWSAPKTGHDPLYFARRTRSLKTFLRHLPDIIKEWYRNEVLDEYPELFDEEGEVVEVDYKEMLEPFLSLSFADNVCLLNAYKNYQEVALSESNMGRMFHYWKANCEYAT